MTGSIRDYTPNFHFIIPEFNITGWHDLVEENFRSIDALFYNIFDIQNYVGRWQRLTEYEADQVVFIADSTDTTFMGKMYKVLVDHTTTNLPFNDFYEAHPEYYERFLDASSAQQYARFCKIYNEGTDEECEELDIEHSCKRWNEICETFTNNSQTWAEGDDEDVEELGGTHSAKGWAQYVVNNAPEATATQTDTGAVITTKDLTHGTVSVTISNGEKGDQGEKGDDGEQGPQGPQGPQGVSVTGVSLISTSGLVKTYRMSFSNGTHFDYNVTDGSGASITIDDEISSSSTNPVQNKVIKEYVDDILGDIETFLYNFNSGSQNL